MKTATLFFDGESVKCIGDMPVELGATTRVRASNILPVNRVKRVGFLTLRASFGERGKVAEWTRGWRGPWTVTLFATGETYTHISRRVCLSWENRRLEELLS